MDKSLIINKIKIHLGIKKDIDFAVYLGIKPNVLSNWRSRNTYDIEIISQKCEFINRDWLLTGNGKMLKTGDENEFNESSAQYNCPDCKLKSKLIDELEREIEGLRGENRAYMKMLKIPVLEDDKKLK